MATVSWSEWNTDVTTFDDGADSHTGAVTEQGTDKSTYQANLDSWNAYCASHSPEQGLLYFFYWIATSTNPYQKDNIFGLYDDQTMVLGDCLAVSGDLTNLTTDLTNLFDDSVPFTDVPVSDQCAVANQCITQLIAQFTDDQDVINSFDPSVTSEVLQQLDDMQTTLYTYFTWTAPDGSQQGSGSLTSFDDMKQQMSGKDSTDATDASEAFTDDCQTLTSETQNFNAALNQEVSASTTMDKSWQAFVGSLMKSYVDLTNAVIQNLSSSNSGG